MARGVTQASVASRLLQTDCRHRVIQAARSIPDADIGRLGVGKEGVEAFLGKRAARFSGQVSAMPDFDLWWT